MSTVSELRDRLERATQATPRGVLGFVDELLNIAAEHGLAMNWQNDRCRAHTLLADPEEATDVALSQSVFRAILARVAALCSKQSSKPISPYGGEGRLETGVDSSVLRVTFANRPGEQWLRLVPTDAAARANSSV